MRRLVFIVAVSLAVDLSAQARKLLIFGGEDHDEFVGCLNCNKFDPQSVQNDFGTYGNPFSDKSIKNHFSSYGNPYSPFSACGEFASTPPVVVDENGAFYGELTRNKSRPKRIKEPTIVRWLAIVCADD